MRAGRNSGCNGDIPQLIVANGTNTTTLHLDIERFGSHITHEHYYLQRFDVSARSHERTGNGYAELLIITELAYQFVAVA